MPDTEINMKTFATVSSILLLALQTHAGITVFAAASMTNVMKEMASAFEKDSGESLRFNFASSGALARQIDAGAPADVFISANKKWMDWLEARSVIHSETRFNLAANSLVMIAPKGSRLAFDGQVNGRIAVGDFKSVPAGIYAQEALEKLGWLNELRPNLVMASNTRTALMYVERGEVAAGIVYATDAKASGKVSVVGTFPADLHSAIVYPVVACSNNKGAKLFLLFLKSDRAIEILRKHGFT
jgi:molybdate transport system substrate-binding protein